MTAPLSLKLRPDHARRVQEDLRTRNLPGDDELRRAYTALLLSLNSALGKRERQDEKKAARVPRASTNWRQDSARNWKTKPLRQAVWERSEGRCENPDCGCRITRDTFELDHLLGRGKAPQSPENTWALCSWKTHVEHLGAGCHRRKTDNDPERLYWLEQWLEFGAKRFAGTETLKKVQAEAEAERVRAQFDEERADRLLAEATERERRRAESAGELLNEARAEERAALEDERG